MEIIKIHTEFITLGQFLKYIGLISNGSEAKIYLVNNEISVNDEKETRRGKKLYPKDRVIIKNKAYIIG